MNQSKKQSKTVELMVCLGKVIQDALSEYLPDSGFVLIFFKSEEDGLTNYLTNTKREPMIEVLKEMIKGLEEKKDFTVSPPSSGAVH